MPQIIAANLDRVWCVSSPGLPPFRPRFIDRVLVAAAIGDVPAGIIINKTDQKVPSGMEERLDVYRSLGIPIRYVSAKNGEGLDGLLEILAGKICAFVGQSGVGKSSLLNRLFPGINQDVGELSRKWDRGNHTTCHSLLIRRDGVCIIDTPGIREIEVCGIQSLDLDHYFPEFIPYLNDCQYTPCYHDHEPGCRIKEACAVGQIHADRYESYLRILESIQDQENYGGYK